MGATAKMIDKKGAEPKLSWSEAAGLEGRTCLKSSLGSAPCSVSPDPNRVGKPRFCLPSLCLTASWDSGYGVHGGRVASRLSCACSVVRRWRMDAVIQMPPRAPPRAPPPSAAAAQQLQAPGLIESIGIRGTFSAPPFFASRQSLAGRIF